LPFATIYIQGSNISTTSNEYGSYQLKLDSGNYTLRCVLLSYKPFETPLHLNSAQLINLDIMLDEQSYQLSEVKISAQKEDPAYAIIRKAIAYREIYKKEPYAYSCRTYIKGLQRLTKVPKRVLLIEVDPDIKPGIVYLSESLSDFYFQQPNLIKENLISSKVSGDNRAFTFNRAGAIRFNVYENTLPSYGLNQRGFISPIASNAMMYYNYQLEGEFRENGYTIFKIKLLPKRTQDPVFKGHIYIIKDLWRIHSTDMYIDKSSNIEFVDTLRIRQEYARQDNGVWMPTAQRFIFSFSAFGFTGNGYFVALYSNMKVQSSYKPSFYGLKEEIKNTDPPIGDGKKSKQEVKKIKNSIKQENKVDTLQPMFDKRFFNNEVLKFEEQANKTPDSIWEKSRVIPLTAEEQMDYKIKDSIEVIESSKWYQDSVDRIENKFSWKDLLLTGYTYNDSYRKMEYDIKSLPFIIQYNTVEGLVITPEATITKTLNEERKNIEFIPGLRYGTASEKLYARLQTGYTYNTITESKLTADIGKYVEQFNNNEPISPLVNSLYTLFAEQNFMKLYEQTYGKLGWTSEVVNGLTLEATMYYGQRNKLSNNTDFTFDDMPSRTFTSNDPVNIEEPLAFSNHQAFIINIESSIVFKQRYLSRPDMRIRFQSKYPQISLGYQTGIRAFSADVRFDHLYTSIGWDKNFRIYGYGSIAASGGIFTNTDMIYFMDYKHFNGNQTIFATKEYAGFQLLDYYTFSTHKSYITLQYNHHFNGFWFNKIPVIRKLKWQEVFTINYLSTPSQQHYTEVGVGIEHIFKFFRIDYFQLLNGTSALQNGIRIGFGF
jgi:hypothetical protein